MNVLFFDTETTGLPLFKEPSADPKQPQIVDLFCELWSDDNFVETYHTLINPGVPIPADVTELHGITDAMVEADGIPGAEAVSDFMGLVKRADLIAGFNVSFDIRMMRMQSARNLGVKWENPLPTYCVMRKSMPFVKAPKANPRFDEDWKLPKLTEAYAHFFGDEMEKSHRARPDCEATRRIYFHLKTLEI